MKIRLDNGAMLHGDFTSPLEIAKFTEDVLTEKAKELFVLQHNASKEIFEIFRRHREDCSLREISAMMSEMAHCYMAYCQGEFEINRKYKD